ncbi:MAG: carboxyl transferase domain-containing protein [Hyphomicrobiaceae bacterium]
MAMEHEGWKPLMAELAERRKRALDAGGADRIAREHRLGRSTARERIAALADPGSFLEFGTLVTTPTEKGDMGPTFICGLGEIDGRPVAIGAEDFTVEGGAVGVHLQRIKGSWGGFIEELALGYRIPLVLLMQGTGGSVLIQELKGYAELQATNPLYPVFELLDKVPVLTAVLGPTAGSSAARASIAHFSVMSKDNGCLFTGGPPVVRQALGRKVDKFELGGWEVQAKTAGLIDNAAETEAEALAELRQALSYFPQNAACRPSVTPDGAWLQNDQDALLSIVNPDPRWPYDAQALIHCLADSGTFFEIGPDYGQALRVGFARFEGHVAGVLATDARHMAGALETHSSQKQTRFIETCDAFDIPLVYLADVPGFMVGPEAERAGTLKFASEAVRAIQQTKVPVFTVQVRRSFGLGGQATGNGNPTSLRLAWPSGVWGDMPVEGGVEAAYRAELEAAAPEDRAALKRRLAERFDAQTSIWRTVERFGVEEMIDPRETRRYLGRLLRLAYALPVGS